MDFSAYPFDTHQCLSLIFTHQPVDEILFQYRNNDPKNWGYSRNAISTSAFDSHFESLGRNMFRTFIFDERQYMNVSVTGYVIHLRRKLNYNTMSYFFKTGLFTIISF